MTAASGLITDRYRLGGLLGTGGSASVFAAVDTMDGREVALKFLHPHLARLPQAREAFLAEAERARALHHPNVVAVLGSGRDEASAEPMVWIALERAPGLSLAEHVSRHGPLDVADSTALLEGVLQALEAAHEIGLIHRDVSPSNVMVAPAAGGGLEASGVRLLDFGLADAAGRAVTGADVVRSDEGDGPVGVIGNVHYMSPEQVRGDPVDERGDVYQAGAVLCFALTGRHPFPRPTAGATMRAHLEAPPPVPSVGDSRIPRDLDRVVVRALLKDPADRFATAAEMRAAIAGVQGGEGRQGDRGSDRAQAASDAATPVMAAGTTGVGVTRVLGRTRVPHGTSVAEQRTVVQHRPGGPAQRPVRGQGRPAGARGRTRTGRPSASGRVGAWTAGIAALGAMAAIVALAAANASPVSVPMPSAAVSASVAPEPPPTSGVPPAPEPQGATVVDVGVPEFAEVQFAEARRMLADAGLVLGSVTVVDSDRARDHVLGSAPEAGDRVSAGTAVDLTIASGRNAIPDVAGTSSAGAVAAVRNAGFIVVVASQVSTATSAGLVIGVEPRAGTVLPLGSTVTLVQAASPMPTANPTPPPPTPVPTATPTVAPPGTVRD